MHSLKRLKAEDATSASVCLYVFFWNLRVFVEIYTYSIRGGHNTQKTTLYLFSQRKMQMDLWSPWFPVLISRELTGAGWSCIPEWLAGSLRRGDINTALISENMTRLTDPTGKEGYTEYALQHLVEYRDRAPTYSLVRECWMKFKNNKLLFIISVSSILPA